MTPSRRRMTPLRRRLLHDRALAREIGSGESPPGELNTCRTIQARSDYWPRPGASPVPTNAASGQPRSCRPARASSFPRSPTTKSGGSFSIWGRRRLFVGWMDANIHAREYQLYLPSKKLLKAKLLEWSREQNDRGS
jgi:hypothetical protein